MSRSWWQRLGVLLVGGVLAGCSIAPELAAHLRETRRAWEAFRDASAPVAGVTTSVHAELATSMDRAIVVAIDAAEAEAR